MHTKGLGITNRILAEYVEMIMQSIPTSSGISKPAPMTLDIAVLPHVTSTAHRIAKVTVCGRSTLLSYQFVTVYRT